MEDLTVDSTLTSSSSADSSTYLDFLLSERGITEDQALTLIIASKVSSSLSLLGSIYVLQDVVRDPQKRNQSIYHRTILGVSASDFLVAIFFLLGTWPQPKGENLFAAGNDQTCDVAGFFTVLSWLLSPLYNCSLATYYLLQLKLNWVEHRIKAAEKWMHIAPWSLSIVIPLMAVFMGDLGPSGFVCFLTGRLFFIGLLLQFSAIIYVMVVMYMVFKYIRELELRGSRYSFSFYLSNNVEMKRSQRVMIQGLMYAIAMMLVFLPLFFLQVFTNGYSSMMVAYTLALMQGLANAFIYSGVLQDWCYKNDSVCTCCSLSSTAMATARAASILSRTERRSSVQPPQAHDFPAPPPQIPQEGNVSPAAPTINTTENHAILQPSSGDEGGEKDEEEDGGFPPASADYNFQPPLQLKESDGNRKVDFATADSNTDDLQRSLKSIEFTSQAVVDEDEEV